MSWKKLKLDLFEEDLGYSLNTNLRIRTKKDAKDYFKKLKDYMSYCDLNYYETALNNSVNGTNFNPKNELEKVIRVIPFRDNKSLDNKKINLGIITVNLSEIRNINGQQYYKSIFKTLTNNEIQKMDKKLLNMLKISI